MFKEKLHELTTRYIKKRYISYALLLSVVIYLFLVFTNKDLTAYKAFRYADLGLVNSLETDINLPTDYSIYFKQFNIIHSYVKHKDTVWLKENLNLTSEEIKRLVYIGVVKDSRSKYIKIQVKTLDKYLISKVYDNLYEYMNKHNNYLQRNYEIQKNNLERRMNINMNMLKDLELFVRKYSGVNGLLDSLMRVRSRNNTIVVNSLQDKTDKMILDYYSVKKDIYVQNIALENYLDKEVFYYVTPVSYSERSLAIYITYFIYSLLFSILLYVLVVLAIEAYRAYLSKK